MTINANRPFDNCGSIEDVVAIINDEFSSEFDSHELAFQYALESCVESGEEPNESNIEAHLDYLKEAGALFDYHKARRYEVPA